MNYTLAPAVPESDWQIPRADRGAPVFRIQTTDIPAKTTLLPVSSTRVLQAGNVFDAVSETIDDAQAEYEDGDAPEPDELVIYANRGGPTRMFHIEIQAAGVKRTFTRAAHSSIDATIWASCQAIARCGDVKITVRAVLQEAA